LLSQQIHNSPEILEHSQLKLTRTAKECRNKDTYQ